MQYLYPGDSMLYFLGLMITIQPAPASTPETALAQYQLAVEKRDIEAFAKLTSGPAGESIRKLAPALKKAEDASDQLTKALGEKPALNTVNPFANELNPLRGYQFELIELTPGKDLHLARIRFGLANRLQEETVSIMKEGGGYRISAPGTFLKSIRQLTPLRVKSQSEGLTKLAKVLETLAQQVSKGELTSKEAILIKLAQAYKDSTLPNSK